MSILNKNEVFSDTMREQVDLPKQITDPTTGRTTGDLINVNLFDVKGLADFGRPEELHSYSRCFHQTFAAEKQSTLEYMTSFLSAIITACFR